MHSAQVCRVTEPYLNPSEWLALDALTIPSTAHPVELALSRALCVASACCVVWVPFHWAVNRRTPGHAAMLVALSSVRGLCSLQQLTVSMYTAGV
jgi:hypothetical protein